MRACRAQDYEGTLESLISYAMPGARYRRTLMAHLESAAPIDTLGLLDTTPAYVAWPGQALMPRPLRVDYTRPFDDLAIADLNRDNAPDMVVAGDGAIRVVLGKPGTLPSAVAASEEIPVLSGKPFAALAVTQLGATAAPDLFYIARSPGAASVELGIARQSSYDPPAYAIEQMVTKENGPLLPLVVADVDGAGIPDVMGATPTVFVRSSKSGSLTFLPEGALAIAAGDVDGDGVAEPIFLTADGASVRRVRLSPEGALASELLVAAGGQALAVGDFDERGVADVALVEELGRAGSRVAVYRR